MRNIKNRFLLIAGILIASFLISGHLTIAGPSDLENTEMEQYQLAESIFFEMVVKPEIEKVNGTIFKVYNSNQELVYESRNKTDLRLRNLISKSDLLTTVDHTTFYQLSQ